MINQSRVNVTLKKYFDRVEPVAKDVLRCERWHNQRPYAVYYVDTSDDIVERAKSFVPFQEALIGERFFDGDKVLRSSQYLLFVVRKDEFSSRKFLAAKEQLEANRDYARKMVLPQERLELYLQPSPTVDLTPAEIGGGVLKIWTDNLLGAGLGFVLEGKTATSCANLVEDGQTAQIVARTQVIPQDDDIGRDRLASIELKHYRPMPRERSFNFGRVNLITGVNGAGKTGLLEAIEYLYCGASRRSNKKYHIEGTLADGNTFAAAPTTRFGTFSARQLSWYGVRDTRKNWLWESFSKFNFLYTDAAVHLSTNKVEPREQEDDLARLISGPEAGNLRTKMESVQKELERRTSLLLAQQKTIAAEEKLAKDNLDHAQAAFKDSDKRFSLLKRELQVLRWKELPETKHVARKMQPIISRMLSIVEIFFDDELAQLPRAKLAAERKKWSERLAKLVQEHQQILVLGKKRAVTERKIADARALLKLIEDIRPYFAEDFEDLLTTCLQYQLDETRKSNLFEELSIPELPEELLAASKRSLAAELEVMQRTAQTLRKKILTLNQALKDFIAAKTEAYRLTDEMRAIAAKLTKHNKAPDTCPLCHTSFAKGELEKHIHMFDAQDETDKSSGIRQMLTEHQAELDDWDERIKVLKILEEFCARLKLDPRLNTPRSVLKQVGEASRLRERNIKALAECRHQLNRLAQRGLTEATFRELMTALNATRGTKSVSKRNVDSTASAAKVKLSDYESELKSAEAELNRHQDSVRTLVLDTTSDSTRDAPAAMREINNHILKIDSLLTTLEEVTAQLTLARDSHVSALRPHLERAVSASDQLVHALEIEASLQSTANAEQRRLKKLETEKQDAKDRLVRVKRALDVLTDNLHRHSLKDASAQFIAQHQQLADHIFARIHVPREYEIRPTNDTFLRRLDDETLVTLDEISTGQRAAFALSIFLAMNSLAKSAPQLLLIDDPVAHVDDLNALAFLDFLRGLIVSSKRQLFFATADEKLARLFENKFSFLGQSDYRHIELRRPTGA